MERRCKLIITIMLSFIWLLFSIIISVNWLNDLSMIFGKLLSLLIVSGVAYIPGYISMNLFITLALFQHRNKIGETTYLSLNRLHEYVITILIPVYNEEETIYKTLESIDKQDYKGEIRVIVINNNSKDATVTEVLKAKNKLSVSIDLIDENKQGKYNALNKGLMSVKTKYFVTIDGDTYLHKSAISYILERMLVSNISNDVAAIAGGILVSNGNENLLTRIQKYDYLLSITSIKRMQGLFNSTLVAQGAFSIYKTDIVKDIGGWYDCIGEDIVLTWKLLEKGLSVEYEPKAVCFTVVPKRLRGFIKQRSRWSRGMIEGLKTVPPIRHGSIYSKYLSSIDLLIPYIDISFIFFFIPGLILAILGKYYIVGFLTLFVVPFTLMSNLLMYRIEKKEVLNSLNIKLDIHFWEYIFFILIFQSLNSFSSIIGYFQELFQLKRKWR